MKVDRALQALWNRHAKVIEKAMRREARAFDERWEAAGAIIAHDPPLFRAGGYRTAEDFFRAVLHEPPRSAFRNIRVAQHASPRDEARWGVAKLDAALSFVEASQGKPIGARQRIAFENLRVPLGAGKHAKLEAATVAEVSAATTRLLRAGGRARARPGTRKARAALQKVFEAHEALASIQVHEANGFVSLRRVPVAAWDHFVRALRAARLDRVML